MGPRSDERGKGFLGYPGRSASILLQWGRVRMNAERGLGDCGVLVQAKRFNGAAFG